MFDIISGFTLLRDANRVVAVSEMEKVQDKKMGVRENRIAAILNAVKSVERSSAVGQESFRKGFGIKDDEKTTLCLGRPHKRKGLPFLVRVFREVAH